MNHSKDEAQQNLPPPSLDVSDAVSTIGVSEQTRRILGTIDALTWP
jgi:hypothetical protein